MYTKLDNARNVAGVLKEENPKFEARNPKQIRMTKIQMTRTGKFQIPNFNVQNRNIRAWFASLTIGMMGRNSYLELSLVSGQWSLGRKGDGEKSLQVNTQTLFEESWQE